MVAWWSAVSLALMTPANPKTKPKANTPTAVDSTTIAVRSRLWRRSRQTLRLTTARGVIGGTFRWQPIRWAATR